MSKLSDCACRGPESSHVLNCVLCTLKLIKKDVALISLCNCDSEHTGQAITPWVPLGSIACCL